MQSNEKNPTFPIFLKSEKTNSYYALFSHAQKIQVAIYRTQGNACITREGLSVDYLIEDNIRITREEFAKEFTTAKRILEHTCYDAVLWDSESQQKLSEAERIADNLRHGIANGEYETYLLIQN